ncbi:ketopantoate reductase family protein [Sphingomonas montana]|uniref:ketopantoate reductase family protein n=1 Tax=Sphingomonas montana TaxID=1843236 RepID=UPI0019D235E9|nr:2-dehydropantoate 2-reductase N-terminal domain-containing protein [Sphingomonas montana]
MSEIDTPPPPAPIRIAVIGVGQIGSTFAFQLARDGGHRVSVIARPGSARLAQLQRDGAIVDTKGGRAEVRVLDGLDEHTPYDLVIVTLLAHQVDAVLPALSRSAAKCIQFMFNTFDPWRVEEAVGAARCAFGMPFVQARLDADGRLKATIGAGGQKTLMGRRQSVDLFNAAGLPAAFEPEMRLWLRCHAPLCVAFESVSIAAMKRGRGASWREALVLARGVQASFGLIKALGCPIYPKSKTWLDRSPAIALAATLWSLSRVRGFREVLATGQAECDALVDTLVDAARSARTPVDVARIKAMRPSNHGNGPGRVDR